MNHAVQPVPREVTQAKLDLRSQASAKYRASLPYTISDRLQEQAAALGSQLMLLEGAAQYSYEEVNRRTNQVAHAARALGVRAGDVVALAM